MRIARHIQAETERSTRQRKLLCHTVIVSHCIFDSLIRKHHDMVKYKPCSLPLRLHQFTPNCGRSYTHGHGRQVWRQSEERYKAENMKATISRRQDMYICCTGSGWRTMEGVLDGGYNTTSNRLGRWAGSFGVRGVTRLDGARGPARHKFDPPCSNLRSFGSKCTVLDRFF